MTGVGIFVCLHISADDVHFDPLILSIYVSTLAGASAPLLRPPELLLGPAEEVGQVGPPLASALACPPRHGLWIDYPESRRVFQLVHHFPRRYHVLPYPYCGRPLVPSHNGAALVEGEHVKLVVSRSDVPKD